MGKYARRGALGVVLAALAAGTLGSPAQAATSPYTPQEACNHQFGGSWSTTSDGHRSVTTAGGATWGDVYLMYNSASGYNCVATIKSAYVGTSSEMLASLTVQGGSGQGDHQDRGFYDYYAATEAYAAGQCVEYFGIITNPSGSDGATGGRLTWGNCG